ncbi:hypothetical protein ABZ402_05985 [Streptomyces mirabilis]
MRYLVRQGTLDLLCPEHDASQRHRRAAEMETVTKAAEVAVR